MESSLTLNVYESIDNYIGKISIAPSLFEKNTSFDDLTTIIVLDTSGSMGLTLQRIVNKILPMSFSKLQYKDDNEIKLVLFNSTTKEYKKTVKELSSFKIQPMGLSYLTPAIQEIEKIIQGTIDNNKNACFRILAISDGEIFDKEKAMVQSDKLIKIINSNKIRINAHAIRLYTSAIEPDTIGLSSIMRFNTKTSPKLIDISDSMKDKEISEVIYNLFNEDSLNVKITLHNIMKDSDSNCFKNEPWNLYQDNYYLSRGDNTFWISKKVINEATKAKAFKISIPGEKDIEVNVEVMSKITFDNYQNVIENKIEYYLQKMKILKLLNTNEANREMNKMIDYFESIEKALVKSEESLMTNNSISSRLIYIKNLVTKRSLSLTTKFNQIKNDKINYTMDSKQQADYLQNRDNEVKGVAKLAIKKGKTFDEIAREEVLSISQHIDELKDINESSHSKSFYSLSSTLEGLRTVAKLPTEPSLKNIFDNLTASDIVKLLNIVGVGISGKISEYADPITYRVEKIFTNTFVSVSDIITAEENNNKLKQFGNNDNEIVTSIPYFDDECIHTFMLKYAPRLLEYTASIGIRRMIVDIPYTWEYTLLGGVWKMVEELIKDKSEINVKIFMNFFNSYKNVVGNRFDFVIDLIKEQKEADKNGMSIYIGNNGTTNMTKPLLTLFSDASSNGDIIKRILRALYQYEIFQYVRKEIKKHDKPDEYIKTTLYSLLDIDLEKHKTQLPKLFERNNNPVYYDNFNLNQEKLNDIYTGINWNDVVCMIPDIFTAAVQENPIEAFKKLPTTTVIDDKYLTNVLGIDYDVNKFKLFCLVQAFIQREKGDRIDSAKKKMKILDLGNYKKGLNMVRDYVKKEYAHDYQKRQLEQIKEEQNQISQKLIAQIIECDNKEDFITLLSKGLTIGVITFVITDQASLGFNSLIKLLCDKATKVPLRGYKLLCILTGIDDEDKIVFNKGNHIRDFNKQIKNARELVSEYEWEIITTRLMNVIQHKYRETFPNRQGHSNNKVSYWALGFKTLEDMFSSISNLIKEKYKEEHYNCCGLDKEHKVISYKKEKKKKKKEQYKKNALELKGNQPGRRRGFRGGRRKGGRGRKRRNNY